MSKLYNELASVYHEMYQSIFDYQEEFIKYDSILNKYSCNKILEVGCGSGNLTEYFLNAGYDYIGVDISDDMLKIARENNPGVNFIRIDMRDLSFDREFDAIIVSGRSFTYMTKNHDVNSCLNAINRSLKPNGILIFDNFDAQGIFQDFNGHMEQTSIYKNKKYRRVSNNSINLDTGWTWNWNATYYIEELGQEPKVIEDKSVLRAFTQDELKLFLLINKFEELWIINEGVSFTTIAKRK